MSDTLWLDSSIVRLGARKLRELAKLAERKGVKVLVHAHVHLEMCRYYRERKGKEFSQSDVESSLDALKIEVAPATLDRLTAEIWAGLLCQRYPTGDHWRQAKLSAVRARLPDGATLREDEVPMTTDWLIALEIERQGACVAVGDQGEEWAALRAMSPCRALSYDASMQWLSDRTEPSPEPVPSSRRMPVP
jgi:hypothetical protein